MKDTFHLEDRNEYRTDIFSYGKVNIGNRANQGWSNLRIRSLIREFRGNLVRTRFARRIAIFQREMLACGVTGQIRSGFFPVTGWLWNVFHDAWK